LRGRARDDTHPGRLPEVLDQDVKDAEAVLLEHPRHGRRRALRLPGLERLVDEMESSPVLQRARDHTELPVRAPADELADVHG